MAKELGAKVVNHYCYYVCMEDEFPKEKMQAYYGRAIKAAEMYNIKQIVLGGGVAANSEIRKKFFAMQDKGYKIYAPAMKYCTDNASMIASAAYFLANTIDSLEVEVFSRC